MHKQSNRSRTGARILVDALEAHGLTHAFGVPGESYLAVLDALSDSKIDITICRQESGAAFMAEAAGVDGAAAVNALKAAAAIYGVRDAVGWTPSW